LFDAVEARAPDADSRPLLVQQFLVCAEARYVRYLSILDEFAHDASTPEDEPFVDTMPLPPWYLNRLPRADNRDVAIIFHAHCLSPFRFYADMKRSNRQTWTRRIAFPLERLLALIQNGIWSDVESEQLWTRGETLPYQVWETDPITTQALLRLQPVEMACAWCSSIESFLVEEFMKMHTTKVGTLRCSSCQRKFDADRLSAKYFQDDLSGFLKLHRSW
jgi:hypothetical protein